MMEIIPAIDLISGQCVRLVEGDYSQKTEYSDNPVAMAQSFEAAGIRRLHVVDLEGARQAATVHLRLLTQLCSETSLIIDFGGGIRTAKQVEEILEAGASQVSLGSMAVNEPDLLRSWISLFGPEKFFLGADVLDGFIAIKAWSEQSDLSVETFLQTWMDQGVKSFFSTDVRKDGRLEGPAIELYSSLFEQFPDIDLVASGGVSKVEDLTSLEETGVCGVIIGKAFYENRIEMNDLKPWLDYAG